MPPQQREGLADFGYNGFDFGFHLDSPQLPVRLSCTKSNRLLNRAMPKQMFLFPVFDGQTMGVAAVDPEAIHMARPAVMPGVTNVYIHGDQTVNALGVYMDLPTLLKRLESVGFQMVDMGGAKFVGMEQAKQSSDGH